MNILLTGHKGFIGTYLKKALENLGHYVVGVDIKNGASEDLCDITNNHFVELSQTHFHMIIHLAARAMVRWLVARPELAKENILSTFNVLEFARQNNIKKIIFTSSREVYGNCVSDILKETDSRSWNIESPYAASKLAGEALLQSYKTCYGINYVVCRLSNVFGANDGSKDRFTPILFERLPKNQPIKIFGKDKQLDFTYIDDCVDGLLDVVDNFKRLSSDAIPIYNIAYGKSEYLIGVAEFAKKMFRSSSELIIEKTHTGEVIDYQADTTKFRTMTGWKPKYSVYDGFEDMYQITQTNLNK